MMPQIFRKSIWCFNYFALRDFLSAIVLKVLPFTTNTPQLTSSSPHLARNGRIAGGMEGVRISLGNLVEVEERFMRDGTLHWLAWQTVNHVHRESTFVEFVCAN